MRDAHFAALVGAAMAIVILAGVPGSRAAEQTPPNVGTPATRAEIAKWNDDVTPDGVGLPVGRGSAADGAKVYAARCASCHGAEGQGGPMDRLVGGSGSLKSAKPVKTVGSYWPYATTVFDYVRRAMPFNAPGTLSNDEVYAVTAYVLALNDIVPRDAVLDAKSLPKVRMPNRDGFMSPDPRPDAP